MDAHFREYLAAVAGMQETYGFDDCHAAVENDDCRQNSYLEAAPACADGISNCVAAS